MNINDFAKGKKKGKNTTGGKAIIYTRVSSSEQIDGQSLDVQIEKCRDYAERNNYKIIKEFGGTYESAKSDKERKEFNKMLSFLDKSKEKINAVIVYSTSRFSRTGSTSIIEEVEKRGAVVLSATSNYDPLTAQGKFIQNIELATARLDNDIKRATTIDNSIAALRKGRWIAKPPRGYNQKTTKKEQIITINKEGELIRKAFLWKANENITNEEIRERLEVLGFKINKQKLSELFKNPFYCGYMSHKYLEGEIVKGNHPLIISEEIFLKVNKKLQLNNNGYEHKNDKEYAPLLTTIKCPNCGNNLTASLSTKMRKKFNKEIGYYVCSRKGCKHNCSTESVHSAYQESLNSLSLPDSLTELLKVQLESTFQEMNKESKELAISIRSQLKQKQKELDVAETNYSLSPTLKGQEIIMKTIKKIDAEIEKLNKELEKIEIDLLNPDSFIDFGLEMRNKLFEMWDLQDVNKKRQLQNLIHPLGFIFNKESGHIEPKAVNMFFNITPCFTDNNNGIKKGTNCENHNLSPCVLGAGLEPAQP